MGSKTRNVITLEQRKIAADQHWDKIFKALPNVDINFVVEAIDRCNKVDAEILRVEWRDRRDELIRYLMSKKT